MFMRITNVLLLRRSDINAAPSALLVARVYRRDYALCLFGWPLYNGLCCRMRQAQDVGENRCLSQKYLFIGLAKAQRCLTARFAAAQFFLPLREKKTRCVS
jgi:hypothetical protein